MFMHHMFARSLPVLMALLLLAACAPSAAPPAPAASSTSAPAAPKVGPLKVGVLGVVDMLPFYIAQEEGLWKAEGVEVELVSFRSAVERDAALVAGELDGIFAEMIAHGLINKEQTVTRIAVSIQKTQAHPMYSLVAAPGSGISSIADLKGKDVAISTNTIIEYMVDRLLGEAGVQPTDVNKVAIANMPARVELLAKGQLPAAVLPEPLATMAVAAGATVLANDGGRPMNQSVIQFNTKALDAKADSVQAFVRGYEQGVAKVNANPEQYRSLLVKIAFVPEAVATRVKVPSFVANARVQEAEWQAVAAWLKNKGLLTRDLSYKDIVIENVAAK